MATLDLNPTQTADVRDALVEDLLRSCEFLRDDLNEHLSGSRVGLVDARNQLGVLNRQVEVLEQLDPPGWREPLPPSRRVSVKLVGDDA